MYGGSAVLLIVFVPASTAAVGAFFVLMHLYKVARFMCDEKSSLDEAERTAPGGALPKPPAKGAGARVMDGP